MKCARFFHALLAATVGLLWLPAALAGSVTFEITTPSNTTTAFVTITVANSLNTKTVTVPIPVGMSAPQKAAKISSALGTASFTVTNLSSTTIKINSLAHGTVTFKTGTTGEDPAEKIVAQAATHGSCGFGNDAFASTDAFGRSSAFSCGLVTDVGSLAFTVLASNLADTDGDTIAQALFQQLSPFGVNYGFNMSLTGDVLDFDFDPSKTTAGGGVIFGTTALSDGVFGLIAFDTGEVPEPGSLLLAGAALAGLVVLRRRRHWAQT